MLLSPGSPLTPCHVSAQRWDPSRVPCPFCGDTGCQASARGQVPVSRSLCYPGLMAASSPGICESLSHTRILLDGGVGGACRSYHKKPLEVDIRRARDSAGISGFLATGWGPGLIWEGQSEPSKPAELYPGVRESWRRRHCARLCGPWARRGPSGRRRGCPVGDVSFCVPPRLGQELWDAALALGAVGVVAVHHVGVTRRGRPCLVLQPNAVTFIATLFPQRVPDRRTTLSQSSCGALHSRHRRPSETSSSPPQPSPSRHLGA